MPETPLNPVRRGRGRPTTEQPGLNRTGILAAARRHLEQSGDGHFSMRGIAAELGTDPMALYHHFPNKQALADALVDDIVESLDRLTGALAGVSQPEQRLRVVCEGYLRCIVSHPSLTQHLAQQGGGRLAGRFALLFEQACRQAVPPGSEAATARDVVVDYLHGVALSGPLAASQALSKGWPMLMRGVLGAL